MRQIENNNLNRIRKHKCISYTLALTLLFTFFNTTFAACESSYMSVELHITRDTYQAANANTGSPIKFGPSDYVLVRGKNERLGIKENANQVYLNQGDYLEKGNGDFKVKASGLSRDADGNVLTERPVNIEFYYDHEQAYKYGIEGSVRYTTTLMMIGRELIDNGMLRQKEYDLSLLGSCSILDIFPNIQSYWQ